MNGGQIILADEPTGALDSQSGKDVMALLEKLAGDGHTVILITHDANIARYAHRVIEIRDGLIVSDTGAEAKKAGGRIAVLEMKADTHGTMFSGLGESLRMALRSLRANVFRTVLTLLGIVIGVGSVVAMLAIGEGARQEVLSQIGSMGTNLLLVRPGVPGQRGVGGQVTTLVPADVEAVKALGNVEYALPETQGTVTVRLATRIIRRRPMRLRPTCQTRGRGRWCAARSSATRTTVRLPRWPCWARRWWTICCLTAAIPSGNTS